MVFLLKRPDEGFRVGITNRIADLGDGVIRTQKQMSRFSQAKRPFPVVEAHAGGRLDQAGAVGYGKIKMLRHRSQADILQIFLHEVHDQEIIRHGRTV